MDEERRNQQHARERHWAARARDRERHALEMRHEAERAAAGASTSSAAEVHRAEAATHDRGAQLHREASELQDQYRHENAD